MANMTEMFNSKNIHSQLAGCSPNLRISWSWVNLTKASYCSSGINQILFKKKQKKISLDYLHVNITFKKKTTIPASFVVRISSYSSRILSSRSFSSLSQIIPTCLRENKGCSFLAGDEAPEDVPVERVSNSHVSYIYQKKQNKKTTTLQAKYSPENQPAARKKLKKKKMPASC